MASKEGLEVYQRLDEGIGLRGTYIDDYTYHIVESKLGWGMYVGND